MTAALFLLWFTIVALTSGGMLRNAYRTFEQTTAHGARPAQAFLLVLSGVALLAGIVGIAGALLRLSSFPAASDLVGIATIAVMVVGAFATLYRFLGLGIPASEQSAASYQQVSIE